MANGWLSQYVSIMELTSIISQRNIEKSSSFDLVYEWEDMLAQTIGIPCVRDNGLRMNRWIKRLRLSRMFITDKNAFVFKMSTFGHVGYDKSNIVPFVIDFHLEESQFEWFYKTYSKHKVVFISNKEAFDLLKSKHCPLNIRHLALSISDKYRITPDTSYEKKYDLVLMGRQNPVLLGYLEEYAKQHPDFVYVYRNEVNGHYYYYVSTGEYVGDIINRHDYMNLMRQARVGLYATPGMDGGEERTRGFNQVTPRFLEYVSCGCHIIARYPENSDTKYYELEKFSPNIETYEQFESAMNSALSKDVDMDYYSNYLEKHYTSVRAKELTNVLEKI